MTLFFLKKENGSTKRKTSWEKSPGKNRRRFSLKPFPKRLLLLELFPKKLRGKKNYF
jgi:hypothetical protein